MKVAVYALVLAFVIWAGMVPATVNETQPAPTDLGAVVDDGSPF